MINFEDFQKLNLRVAKIIEAEKISGSKKLLKLKIDLGENFSMNPEERERQIVAGIGKFYQPEELVEREIIIVADLEPREIMGFSSQGMLLAANVGGRPVLLKPDEDVPPGSKVT